MMGKYMKNKIKLAALLTLLVMLSSGCSASYYTEITNKGIKESVSLVETSRKTYENAYKETYGSLDGFYEGRLYLSDYINQKTNFTIDKYYINKDNFYRDNKVTTNQMYNSEYRYSIKNDSKELSLKNNFFINNIVKDSIIVNDSNIILHLDNLPAELLNSVDDITITIYTELNVTANNADSVEGNSYIWKIDKTNYLNKALSMYIERPKIEKADVDNAEKKPISKKDKTAYSLILFIVMYLAIIIAVINFFNKKKKLF